MLKRAFARTLALWIAIGPMSAFATQNELVPPTSGIYTGVQFSQKLGDAFKSLASCNKGPSAPANVGGATVDGQCWVDDTTSLWIDKFYVNGGWAVRGAYNASDSTYLGVIGGGVPATIASGSTVDLGSVPQANVLISGNATVTGFGSSAASGIVKIIRFAAALTLTNSTALTIPCGYNLVTAANDRAMVTHLGSGNWEVTQYTRDSGIPIDCSAVGKADFTFAGAVPALHVLGDGSALTRTAYPAYLAKVTIAQNGTRTSGNATIASVASTARMGVGMPVEATGINAGCTIASLVANTSITLNSSSCVTASGTSTVTVFLTGYGSGGSSSTVGVKDCTGRTLAGRETTATRLTASYFGGNSTAMGSVGGLEYASIGTANTPPFTPLGTITSTISTATGGGVAMLGWIGTGSAFVNPASGATGVPLSTAFSNINGGTVTSTFTGTPGGGTSTPFAVASPMLIADCVVRVTP